MARGGEMNADRIDFYANQLRGVLIADLGRKMRDILREATTEAEQTERAECAQEAAEAGARSGDLSCWDVASTIKARGKG